MQTLSHTDQLRGPDFATVFHHVARAFAAERPDLAPSPKIDTIDVWTWQGEIHFHGRTDFGLHIRSSRPRRLIVSGLCPAEASPRAINNARITVSHTRTAEAIARDICRRMLPKYLDAHREADATAQRNRTYEENKRRTLAAIAAHLGQVPSRHLSDRVTRPAVSSKPRIEARVGGDRITLTIYDLDLATARRLCRLADN